ncbi:teichoic acid transport system ATP-binding protein [Arcanobacterium wilhelmae]|uniref:Teichoic acid transport system ATP-binding protein n=1 Tax=Arcanobacterium wilhelmae TaxID=1803177 RepID=A0ABT9NBY9_9ACTO|nr:ABC transporter ATP-binding protein [Arcanobacterium wilhelmae]MDP9801223.1 teichoic acid transport system ATP-binding protein [Arcanobacterium wilhelmae]WFN90572.1 ABC transporter ATP-binding protein [Arcanobacterium wilhelmae]
MSETMNNPSIPEAGRTPSMVIEHVSVNYLTPSAKPEDKKNAPLMQRILGALLGRPPKMYVPAVKDVSFIAYEGDFIGLLGQNGAGKSTLLRVLAGSEPPSKGAVYTATRPSLLGVNGALMPELSGIENAKLGLLALGFSPEEAEARIPEILDFCAIGDAIYRPMKTYSSGMGARLRFAISTAARPEILLIDEALSTGDSTFQQKSEERMSEMLSDAGTIFLVSHSAGLIEKMCNRAIWLNQGQIVTDGPAGPVSKAYQAWAKAVADKKPEEAQKILDNARTGFVPLEVSHKDKKKKKKKKKEKKALEQAAHAAPRGYQPRHLTGK